MNKIFNFLLHMLLGSSFGTHWVDFFAGPSWLNMILVMVAKDVPWALARS